MTRKEYSNEAFGVSFTLPEEMTTRQHLQFRERLFRTLNDVDMYSRYWDAAMPLIEDWKCELIPDPAAVDLDTETSKAIADLVFWAANTIAGHMHDMDDVPKNS